MYWFLDFCNCINTSLYAFSSARNFSFNRWVGSWIEELAELFESSFSFTVISTVDSMTSWSWSKRTSSTATLSFFGSSTISVGFSRQKLNLVCFVFVLLLLFNLLSVEFRDVIVAGLFFNGTQKFSINLREREKWKKKY